MRVLVISDVFREQTRRKAIQMADDIAPRMTLIANVLEQAREQRWR
jgi:hypothetical protein